MLKISKAEKVSNAIKSGSGMGSARIEKHKVHVMEHNLVVSGVKVSEKKERITVTLEDINGNALEDGKPIKTIVTHSRTIGDRKYLMQNILHTNGESSVP